MEGDQFAVFARAVDNKELGAKWLKETVENWLIDKDTHDDIIAEIEDYVAAVSDGTETPQREVLATVTKADLEKLGIKDGTFWEEAPWKLIKLRASDLGTEGRKMRHCVGDQGMRYARRVADGVTEIWSLRDRNNKPMFTLEVDADFHTKEKMTPRRAQAIKQLKGKVNRTPGYAERGSSAVTKPHEVMVWKYLLHKLHVNPEHVVDFGACRVPQNNVAASASKPQQGTWRLAVRVESAKLTASTPKWLRRCLADAAFLLSD
jgi:hypothetical protein